MTRLHPFDYVFGSLADQRFGEIRSEAARAGVTLDARLRFHRFEPVRRLLGDLRPPDGGPLAAAALEEYGALLYLAYRFWLGGRRTLAISRSAMERELDTAPAADPVVPAGACYVQFPEQWFWGRIAPDAPHEPLDGMFLAAGGAPSAEEIVVLAVLGLREDRGGFSQITIAAPPPDFRRAAEGARQPRFAPVMEGGERAGMRSIVSEGELLHLAHLALLAAGR